MQMLSAARAARQPAQRVEHSQGRQFYNRRHHTNVLQAILKVERPGQRMNRLTPVVEMLTAALRPAMTDGAVEGTDFTRRAAIIEAVAAPGTGSDPYQYD